MASTTQPSTGRRLRTLPPFPIYDDPNATTTPIPAGHFLAPTAPPTATSTSANRQSPNLEAWSSTARPDTSTVAAADYDVSVVSGFLPPEEPVQSLKGLGGGWDEVEDCLTEVQKLVVEKEGEAVGRIEESWCEKVRQLVTPDMTRIATVPQQRRAHVALAFLTHFYIHSSFPSKTSVPAPLAVPFVDVSDRLGIPPILTYADTVLWNYTLKDKALGLRADNVTINTLFTSSPSERGFFVLSLLCEMVGPSVLHLMSSTLDEAFFSDSLSLTRIATYLLQISSYITDLRSLIASAVGGTFGDREEIIPREFYWLIRPWFNGGKWVYQGVGNHGEDVEMEWGGPSAGQSSLVHAIDLFLEVDHSPRGPPAGDSASTSASTSASSSAPTPLLPTLSVSPRASTKTSSPPTDASFMSRMSTYMPGPHRAFLTHLTSLSSTNSYPSRSHAPPSVRSLAKAHGGNLQAAYNVAVKAMKGFRDAHFVLATHFIMAPARTEPGRMSVHWASWDEERKRKEVEQTLAIAAVAAAKGGEEKVLKGTGGTDLAKFLKTCRERTVEAVLKE